MDNELTQDENIKKIDSPAAWANHFARLFKTTSIGNNNFELFPLNKINVFSKCNITPTWNDITTALKSTPNNKAAGIHGIPRKIWKLVNKAWNECNLIDPNNTSAVVSIFKRENCQNSNKYYDIS
ncbi:hypothetical protein BB561_004337 [Smittium simulii]|uniref:Uncharacterized protein n=1 Tax=Smittium simulii TaxID=133385 RepID=A0A2T9YGT5_9FUNG|nr:hypothetical protein BB561_004337 [Smittium simulii]